jgi:hypothetical protein
MSVTPLLAPILGDEALTRRLGDAEARVLIEWLVEHAEHLGRVRPGDAAAAGVRLLCRRGRAVARFVALYCHDADRGGAAQLAASEGRDWPLPDADVDPCELMQAILTQEAERLTRN